MAGVMAAPSACSGKARQRDGLLDVLIFRERLNLLHALQMFKGALLDSYKSSEDIDYLQLEQFHVVSEAETGVAGGWRAVRAHAGDLSKSALPSAHRCCLSHAPAITHRTQARGGALCATEIQPSITGSRAGRCRTTR